ncbi:phospholipase a2-activating protein [Anaeramoeba flamelloides]|uniref:Phospholipase a2-activating protein n=1 Tax=Anaeramoeba flamelloides TaxID=1746091 RepID=A0AAV7YFI2_9EUKA|nr:phospholipase a2-activating protein [Anaeramoeba flamelloides]
MNIQHKYHISSILKTKRSDLSHLESSQDGTFFVACFGNYLEFWLRLEGNDFYQDKCFKAHESEITYLKISPQNRIISCGRDKVINIWTIHSNDPEKILIGHLDFPTCCDSNSEGNLLSGSNDGEVLEWDLAKGTKSTFCKISTPIENLIYLSNGDVLLLGRDGKFYLVDSSKEVSSYKVNPMSISVAPGGKYGFFSMTKKQITVWKNDCTSILKSIEMEEEEIKKDSLLKFQEIGSTIGGITEFYSIQSDNKLKIYKYGKLVDFVEHSKPIEGFTPIKNFDGKTYDLIVYSNNVFLLYTVDHKKFLDNTLCQYQTSGISEPLVIYNLGEKQAWVLFYNNNKWRNIGKVFHVEKEKQVQKKKKFLNGIAYDHVFELEMSDSGIIHRIGINEIDNPFIVARKFLEKNRFNMKYLDRISHFLHQQLSLRSSSSTSISPLSSFTGGYTTKTSNSQSNTVQSGKTFPYKRPLCLKAVNSKRLIEAIFDDLEEAIKKEQQQQQQQQTKRGKGHMLSDKEKDIIQKFGIQLKNKNILQNSKPIPKVYLQCLQKILIRTQREYIFPFLDLLRVMLLNTFVAEYYSELFSQDIDILNLSIMSCGEINEKTPIPLKVTIMRIFANLYVNTKYKNILSFHLSTAINYTKKMISENNNSIRLATATFLLNLSTQHRIVNKSGLSGQPLQSEIHFKMDILNLIIEFISFELTRNNKKNEEITFRAVTALGNYLFDQTLFEKASDVKKITLNVLKKWRNSSKISKVIREIIEFSRL